MKMSSFLSQNVNQRVDKGGLDLSKFEEILGKKYQQQMRERRGEFFNRGRSGLLSPDESIQETLTEIVRKEFNDLTTAEKTEMVASKNGIMNYLMGQDEALKGENEIIADEELWIIKEYERLVNSEDEMFDMLQSDAVYCPTCQKLLLEEIPDFLVCHYCGLKIRSEISLEKLKSDLELCVTKYSENSMQVPQFSLLFGNRETCLFMSCSTCTRSFLIHTATGYFQSVSTWEM